MKKIFLSLLLSLFCCAYAMAAKIEIDGLTLTVSATQKAEISKAEWAHAFKVDYSIHNIYGDCCIFDNGQEKYGVITPNGVQGYILYQDGMEDINSQFYVFDTGNWKMLYFDCDNEAITEDDYTIKYIYVYDKDDVFMVIYAEKKCRHLECRCFFNLR